MCLPAAGAGAAATATASASMQAAGLAISAIGTAAGIAQGMASMSMQAQQAQQSMDLQYQQSQQQAYQQNQQIIQQHKGEINAQRAGRLSYNQQIANNQEATSRAHMAEQAKLNEARQAAAFKSQEIYAKQIGAVGSVLATGQTGQSIGALVNDANRQAGFAKAKETATMDAAFQQTAINMETASLQEQSLNNQAWSNAPTPVAAPVFAAEPTGVGKDLGLGIPSYDWS